MKKSLLTLVLTMAVTAGAFAKGQSQDPVLMTIDNKPVNVSEFNYLYEKNNSQQVEAQPLDQYLDMFVIYKLKVADAEAAGIQNTDAFIKEYTGYQRDLAQPYLIDPNVKDSLVMEFYTRLGEEVKVSHVMVDKKFGVSQTAAGKHLIDSLRNVVVNGGDFAEIADRYSVDPSVKRNHGDLGWISAGRYPYSFETVAYETPVGEISPSFETPFGYHFLKVTGRRPAQGEVLVQHILELTDGLSDEEKAQKKARIDSISIALSQGADFDTLAKQFSEDPGSASNGGRLSWFGTGRMVPEFEAVAFSLADGEISQPFATSFGWHIIKRLDSRQLPDFEKLRPSIESFIERDERQSVPYKAKTRQLRNKFGIHTIGSVYDEIANEVTKAGALDSSYVNTLKSDSRTLIAVNAPGKDVTVAQVFAKLPSHVTALNADQALASVLDVIDDAADNAAIDSERVSLLTDNTEYRNLLNEYRDGMLLFEISDRNVWSKAKNDTEGLNRYFNEHRSEYTDWTAPKFKGFVIFATSDSVANEAQEFLAGNPLDRRDVAGVLQSRFGKNIKVERVIAAQGENPIIDYLAFGGEKASPSGKWVTCFAYQGEIIDQPVEADDVRGRVTTDYQNYLEKQWVEQLKKQHKVKIDKKVLKQLKAQQPTTIKE